MNQFAKPFAAPRKSLGQNFLQDPNIINKIVAALNVQADEVVLEIGPGRGALTDLMLPLANKLHLVEFDRDLAEYWQSRTSSLENLRVHSADILKFDLSVITASEQNPVKVIGNLPYNISSPVLFHLMGYADQIHSQVVMLQKEVVQRMSASPGGRDYGRLSVMLQQRYHIEYLFTVPPGAFFPPPKVESAIARLTPFAEIPHPVKNAELFGQLVKQAFSQRRKTLRNTLKGTLTEEQMALVGVDAGARAETLTVGEFAALANSAASD